MTPTAAELLAGIATTLALPPEPEDMALFVQGRLGVIALVSILASQEAERGAAVRAAENGELRRLLGSAERDYPAVAGAAADPGDGDLGVAALDAANAALRRRLIALHAAVEAAGDAGRDRQILALYRRMAAARVLALPSVPAPARP